MMTGVDGWLKCGAFERALASVVGVKVPFSIIPRACAWIDVSWLFLSLASKHHGESEIEIVMGEDQNMCHFQSHT
jgi:hypothetical protein